VIARKEIPVLPGDTAESLAARVLQQEHVLLPATVRRLAAEGQTVAVRD
jgi:phosphoribosylglycinamide formyltransferase-1